MLKKTIRARLADDMPCTPFTIGTARGFICTRSRRLSPRCACSQPATLQCDAPTKRRSGTCDKHLCAACATDLGDDRHLCPAHAAAQAAPAPVQAEMFSHG